MTSVLNSQPPPEVVRLRVRRPGAIDPGRVCEALAEPGWLGEPVTEEGRQPGVRRFLTDLVLPLPPDGRLLSLRKAALVDVGRPKPGPDGGCTVEVAWRSATLAPLFPVFAGRLVARLDGLTLEGSYAPPGGALGRAADRMLLHTAASATARWFLAHVAESAGA